MVGDEVTNWNGGGERERRKDEVVSVKTWETGMTGGRKVQGVYLCVSAHARACSHASTCQNTDVRNGMWKLTEGLARPSEAASSAFRQNVFFTLRLKAGTSLLQSSGQ